MKDDDNTSVHNINTITSPQTKTMIDRYVFASNFCKNKAVLDCACGYGYGMYILEGLGAIKVTGIDLDEKPILELQKKHKDAYIFDVTENWSKKTETVLAKNAYDVIVSIETFEHIKREDVPQMLHNFKHVCKPEGQIIITTPRRPTPMFKYSGGTHLYEYNLVEFVGELSKVFGEDFKFYAGLEFQTPHSPERHTAFSDNPFWYDKATVFVAVIKNKKEQ